MYVRCSTYSTYSTYIHRVHYRFVQVFDSTVELSTDEVDLRRDIGLDLVQVSVCIAHLHVYVCIYVCVYVCVYVGQVLTQCGHNLPQN